MGLDMYVRRVSKLSESEVEFLTNRYFDPDDEDVNFDYTGITKYSWGQKPGVWKNLEPFVTPVTMINKYIDLRKLCSANNIPLDWEVTCRGYTSEDDPEIEYVFSSPDNKETRSIQMKSKEFEKLYVYDESETVYCWHEEDVSYFRKEYDLRDKINEVLGFKAINLGYFKVSEKMAEVINEFVNENYGSYVSLATVDHVNSELFYHPWW